MGRDRRTWYTGEASPLLVIMNALRTALERISRHIVLRRALPVDLGGRRIYVSPDAALAFWRSKLEKVDRDLFRFARHLVKRDAVVGASAACAMTTLGEMLPTPKAP